MATFTYRVKTSDGRMMSGKLDAEDQRSAVSRLQKEGCFVFEVREVRAYSVQPELGVNPSQMLVRQFWNPIFGGASIHELAVFFRMLATMVKSGLSLVQALSMLRTQGGNRRLRKISGEMLIHVQEGGMLCDALAQYPWMFTSLQVNLIRAGETGGMLEGMLLRIADLLDNELEVRRKIKFATLYPKILVLAVIFIPTIPKLVIEGLDAYLKVTVYQIIPMVVFFTTIWVIYRILLQFPSIRYVFDCVKLKIPKLGKTVKMFALSKFYRSLAAMSDAGVPLSQGIKHASDAAGNEFISRRLKRAIRPVEQGRTVTESLRATNTLPRLALDMIATGEQTGNVNGMLDKVAEYTENEAEVNVFQMITIGGTLIFLAIAAYIGFIVITSWSGGAYIKGISEWIK